MTAAPGTSGPGAPLPLPGQAPAPPHSGQKAAWRIAISTTAVVGCVAAAFLLLPAGGPHAGGMPARKMTAGGVGQIAVTRVVQVAADSVGAIDLQGVPGQLAIVGTGAERVTLTGQVSGSRAAPVVVTRLDRTANVLVVSIRCATASTCTQNLRLAVPADTGTVLTQSGGQVVVVDLAGPLHITAANANITANGLRSPSLTAVITNGHMTAAFTVPPQQVSITLASAQAAVRLPVYVAYLVNQEVMSGYIRDAVPQESTATRTVTAHLESSELELLPA
jgi:hypothetical protein